MADTTVSITKSANCSVSISPETGDDGTVTLYISKSQGNITTTTRSLSLNPNLPVFPAGLCTGASSESEPPGYSKDYYIHSVTEIDRFPPESGVTVE
jgi:hypothetical protein